MASLQALHGNNSAFAQVDKAAADFYELYVSQQHIDEGFLVAAHSTQGSRFKLLLFEEQEDSKWELLLQVTALCAVCDPVLWFAGGSNRALIV